MIISSYKTYLLLFIIIFVTSCSNNKLEKLGVIKKKASQYSVVRKAPLEMPPDMYLRPPENKKINNSNLNAEGSSLDEILMNKDLPKLGNLTKNQKNQKKQNRILKKILNNKTTITLK